MSFGAPARLFSAIARLRMIDRLTSIRVRRVQSSGHCIAGRVHRRNGEVGGIGVRREPAGIPSRPRPDHGRSHPGAGDFRDICVQR